MNFKEILYEKSGRIAKIAINRPKKLNAATPITVYELATAFMDAWSDKSIGVVILTGAGEKAFCVGGDQSIRDLGGYKLPKEELENYRGTIASLPLEVGWQIVTFLIRYIPKPVIARVNGYAVGGGHVWQVACDFSIASETAKLGQAGPRIGSFDPGFGTGDLWRNVGLKRAKEIWFLTKLYTAEEAYKMGLVNKVVPPEKLDEEVMNWANELLKKSPTTLKMLKYSFLSDIDGLAGITMLGVGGLSLYYMSDEALEGQKAFMERRNPDFWKYVDR